MLGDLRGQVAALAIAAAQKLVVDLLRDPYDAAAMKAGVACLTDFGWRACQIKAAIEKICSGEMPR